MQNQFRKLVSLRSLISDRRGAIALVFGATLVPLIAFVGVGVDYARLVHMKTTLQAAADAAAISGAAANFGSTVQETTPGDDPKSVATGYFASAWLPPNLSVTPNISAPPVASTSGATVTVTATAKVGLSFLAFLQPSSSVSVTATANAEVPSSAIKPFPFTLPECLYNSTNPKYWNATSGEPVIDPKTGEPYEITMDSLYHTTNNCTYGQWTSLNTDSNAESTIKGYITNGCGCTSIGTSIYIQPGTEASAYKDAAVADGQTVVLPIVNQSDLTVKSYTPIVGFGAFTIDSTDQGGKTITGHFASNYQGGGLSGTGGTYYGVDTVKLTN